MRKSILWICASAGALLPVAAVAEEGSGEDGSGAYCDFVEGEADAESALLIAPEIFGRAGYQNPGDMAGDGIAVSPDQPLPRVTLGLSCLLLPIVERLRGPIANVLLAFGRTPLFVFVLHIYVAHGAALLIGVLAGVPASYFANFVLDPSRLVRSQWGFPIAGVYCAWFAVLAVMYPLASWFATVKHRRRDWWLSYL